MTTITFEDTAYVLFNEPLQLVLPFAFMPAIFGIGSLVSLRDSSEKGALGRIVEFSDGYAIIHAPKHRANKDGFWVLPFTNEDSGGALLPGFVEIEVPVEDLILSDGYSVETLSDLLFYNYYHHYSDIPRELFTKENCPVCWHEGCTQVSYGVALINFIGSIYPVVVCKKHSKWHRYMTESYPFTNKGEKFLAAMSSI